MRVKQEFGIDSSTDGHRGNSGMLKCSFISGAKEAGQHDASVLIGQGRRMSKLLVK